jgi:hypothetical protein
MRFISLVVPQAVPHYFRTGRPKSSILHASTNALDQPAGHQSNHQETPVRSDQPSLDQAASFLAAG